ncbi:dihydropteroate synthase [Pseudonocardia sp. NPDC049154]|uniref:dihydropteroate synthase n=1 Tax=Pseudonocardia sp. NPDC049154 TaxID=3155501 RepID=UPI0033F4D174
MGILNVTADSFSDGGRYLHVDRAVAHGLRLVAEGADIVDVGGESTRPGAQRVPATIETDRVVPVVRELARSGVTVSIDTTRASVARAAVAAGAHLINDVSGGLADPLMVGAVADCDVPYVAMHWRAPSADMHRFTSYDDVVTDVIAALARRLDALSRAGVDLTRVIVDPGLGFAKTAEQNWTILGRLDEFKALGRPILVGASRKAFLGAELARDGVTPPPPARDTATAAYRPSSPSPGSTACASTTLPRACRPPGSQPRCAAAATAPARSDRGSRSRPSQPRVHPRRRRARFANRTGAVVKRMVGSQKPPSVLHHIQRRAEVFQ